jgi:propionyl-CoA carboxylase beta chain
MIMLLVSTHSTKLVVAHCTSANDVECLEDLKKIIEFIPQSNKETTAKLPYEPNDEVREQLATIIPDNPSKPYDMHGVIAGIIDEDSFFEVHKHYAENIIVGFARLGGRSISIVANQPLYLAGVLDVNSSKKAARFTCFCDCFNIPLLVLVDVPGFLPGTDQEWQGVIVHDAKLLYALSKATVPRVTVITRKAYGGAYDVMNSKHIGVDMNYAWPTAEIAVMGAKGLRKLSLKTKLIKRKIPQLNF